MVQTGAGPGPVLPDGFGHEIVQVVPQERLRGGGLESVSSGLPVNLSLLGGHTIAKRGGRGLPLAHALYRSQRI
jgi:hypothetical protein